MQYNFTGKNYLITGCTSGMGYEVTKTLLESGATILGIGRDANKVESFINEYKNVFSFLFVDLDKEFTIEGELLEFVSKHGKLHGFVNCAGKEETLPITMYNFKKLKDIFSVNFNAPFEILRLISKKKISYDGSSYILLSSVMGELGQPGKTAYCASKSALLGLVRSASLELSTRGIRVNAVSPGVVDTPMTQKLFGQITDENKQNIINMHPLGIGTTHDVIPTLLFLLSDGSRWITGQNLIIDGGYSVQ